MIKQWRALNTKANYDAAVKHKDMIFFSTDTHEILVNGQAYGLGTEALKALEDAIKANIKTIEYTAPNVLKVTTAGGASSTITLGKPVQGDGSVIVTQEAGNYKIEVAVKAGDNALKKDTNGSLYVDNDALISYSGKEAISVQDDATNAGVRNISLVINANDKVLSQSTTGLLATLGLNYDGANRKIQLVGNGAAVISEISAEAFVKDGMISDVELVTNPEGQATGTYLKITWNTDAGISDPMYVNVTSLIDVYTKGNGINIVNKTISVVIDPASESFISLGAAGIKVSGIQKAIDDGVDALKTIIDAYTINGKKISTNPVLGGADIKITGYTQGTDASDLVATDTVNSALAKIINQVEAANAWYVG